MDPRVDLIRSRIRDVADFPKPGILFRDITPLLSDGIAFRTAIDLLAEQARPLAPEVIVGIESRGFLFGAPLATALGIGFVPVRKPGKLPHATTREEYDLEYGTDAVEMHTDALSHGTRVLVVDDVIATGGTARATCKLVKRLGGELVGAAFLIELTFLDGGAKLAPIPTIALLRY
ncbi:adenine phosphoribosyltransferase [Sandaracinus amylolyticus]|uniref:adenine phosphoribosyltransferase n=1 Tax=Sandaracinus amylolyticus TaxID=927083 RepID=UPI001F0045D1|nr:adenine phosphoribosyltransferase [Sandaracinus amylolyticus]UJR79966.1 Adenine phosphoribosyltransferase [Sandaracinus amylolyticus]